MRRNRLRNHAIGFLGILALTGCGDEPDAVRVIKSPDGAVTLNISKSDPGACCSNRLRISGRIYGGEVEKLAEIEGSSDVRYEWSGRDTLTILACNATGAEFRSGFQNEDYTRRFVLSVENERPQEDGDRVLCGSESFNRMSSL